MRILVDADACPVVKLIEKTAERYGVETVLFCDTNHVLYSEYSTVRTIGAGADAVDFALTAECRKGDIVVTQDYGVAAMILSKGAHGLHQSGMRYTNENIDRLLAERHMAKKARMSRAKHHMKGPKKRTQEDDARFLSALETLLAELSEET
ncbi:MAG: YaiI/YqxD family protein [Clostridia bacterium]|nr:YaiI/YqxD family protein [Clostridia bacterium]